MASSSIHILFGASSSGGILTGSDANEILYGGSYASRLTGGGGVDTFVIAAGNGSVTVTDFAAAQGEVLRLQGYGFTSFAQFTAAAKQSGSDVVVSLGNGETLTLENTQLSALGAGNLRLDAPGLDQGRLQNWISSTEDGSTVSGTSGNDQITGNSKTLTLVGGSGDDVYIAYDVRNVVIEDAGGGNDTIRTWGSAGYVLPEGQEIENLVLEGSWDAVAVGNHLDNRIVGNSAANLIVGDGGNDVLTGGGGRDIFAILKGDGSDTITDFQAGAGGDYLSLSGFGFTSFTDVSKALHQVGSDVVLDLGDGTAVTLQNTSLSSLTAENFALPVDTSKLVQTFRDDFKTFDRVENGTGTWLTRIQDSFDGAYTKPVNDEQQVYVDADFKGLSGVARSSPLGIDPFAIVDGKLVITAAPVSAEDSAALKGYDFTSGIITTQTSFTQTYGYFEITAELPQGSAGVWPAFWMLPVDGSTGEIDILEAFGDDPDKVHQGAISGGSTQTNGSWISTGDLGTGSHTFAVSWTPYELTFYVDDVMTYTMATPTDMHDPMYLIANLAMGGDGSWSGPAADGTTAQFTIDSIVAYQYPEYSLAGYTLKASGAWIREIYGTSGADTITGTDANETINGRTGADVLTGLGGDDIYYLNNKDAQVIEAFDGGIDTIVASISYTLPDHVENLTAASGSSWTALTGNALPNIITGNAYTNIITGGTGNDILTGGGGTDTFVFSRGDGSDIITDFRAGSGSGNVIQLNDFRFSTFAEVQAAMTEVGDDTYIALSEFETLVLRNVTANDLVASNFKLLAELPQSGATKIWQVGWEATSAVYGTSSNERFETSAPVTYGGKGDDTYLISDSTHAIVEYANEGIDSVDAYVSYVLSANIENLALKAEGISGTGNELANRIVGTSGSETINGKGGNDWISGGAGNDTFLYEKGSGYDTIADFAGQQAGGSERDKLVLSGYDISAYLTNVGDIWTVHYSGGTDTFRLVGVTALRGDDYIFITSLEDGLAGIPASDGQLIRGNDDANVLNGTSGADHIQGGGGSDYIYGGRGVDTLNGQLGNDILYGNDGEDTLYGEEGDDILHGGNGNDQISGGIGSDMLYGEEGDDFLDGGVGNDIIYGQTGRDLLHGGEGDDSIYGGTDDDRIFGELGNDLLYGEIGDDIIDGGDGDDKIYGQVGNDSIYGGSGNDSIYGGDGNDIIYGNDGNDTIYGGEGIDTINSSDGDDYIRGGTGNDILTGGLGADKFVFEAAATNGNDQITDFQRGTDKLVFTAADYGLTAGALPAGYFETGTAATSNHATFVFNTTDKTLAWDPDGAGGASAIVIATFTDINIGVSDILLV